jgi:hypothetical protein
MECKDKEDNNVCQDTEDKNAYKDVVQSTPTKAAGHDGTSRVDPDGELDMEKESDMEEGNKARKGKDMMKLTSTLIKRWVTGKAAEIEE